MRWTTSLQTAVLSPVPLGAEAQRARLAPCPRAARPHLAALSRDPVSFHSVPGHRVGFLFLIQPRSLSHCFSLSLHQNFLLSPKQFISPAQLGLRSLPLILPSPQQAAQSLHVQSRSHTRVFFSVACSGEGRVASGILDSRN